MIRIGGTTDRIGGGSNGAVEAAGKMPMRLGRCGRGDADEVKRAR
jgi:hypothetical protein